MTLPGDTTEACTEDGLKERRGVRVYDQNPFMAEIQTKVRRVCNKTGDMMLISKAGGDVVNDVAGFWSAQEVDSTKFVKLFVNGVKALTELTGSGTKVFEILYHKMQEAHGRDYVYMAFAQVDQGTMPMSKTTYARGMRELIAKEFIAATPSQGLYWVNPNFLWNGDRLRFVQDYVRVEEPRKRSPSQLFTTSQPALPFEES